MTEKSDLLASLFGAVDASTFLGLDYCDDLATIDASSAFVGVPCATPYLSVGPYAKNGPASIRTAGASWTANVDRHNFDVGGVLFPDGTKRAVDIGDLHFDEVDFASNRATIRETVVSLVQKGVVPIVIGGDDSVPIPMLDALADTGDRYTVLQIDAHIDWRDEYQGERLGLSSNMRRASEMAHIEAIIQVGARGIGSAYPQDVQDALDWGVKLVPAADVATQGIAPVLDLIPQGTTVVICIDIDGLDPSIAPNTIGRAPGGLHYHDALGLIVGASERGTIAAINFVEILPENDIDGQGGGVCRGWW